jgi:branched-chain amino acid transport system substrate-binding protein
MSGLSDAVARAKRCILKYGFLAAIADTLFLGLAACAAEETEAELGFADVPRGPETPIVIPAGEPIVAGVSTALTGPAAPRGREYRDAVVVAVQRWKAAHGEQIAGHDIFVVAEDDGCTESVVTQSAAGRLLKRPGLVGVMGPQCSAGTAAAQHMYTDAGVVAISGSATATGLAEDQPGEGFFFRTAYRNDLQGILIGTYFSDPELLGAEHVYIIHDNETYGSDLAFSADQVLRAAGVNVHRSSVNRGAVDFSQLAAEVAAEDPDGVFFAGFNPEAILLLRQLRDAGWNGAYGAAECEFLAALGEQAEGAAFSGCSPPMGSAFLAEFTAVHGAEPTAAFITQYADAATILLNAVQSVAQADGGSVVIDPNALREAVARTTLPSGLSGDVAFNPDGDRASSVLEGIDQFPQQLGLVPCRIENGAIAYFN